MDQTGHPEQAKSSLQPVTPIASRAKAWAALASARGASAAVPTQRAAA